MTYSIPLHITPERVQEAALSLLSFSPEFSLITSGTLAEAQLEIYPRPRELTEEEAAALVAALNALPEIPLYMGVKCSCAADVDRVTNAAISNLLAPNTPSDLQQLRREKRLAETAALSAKSALGIALGDDERALLMRNLQIYQGVMQLSADGDAFKAAQGWGGTDAEKE